MSIACSIHAPAPKLPERQDHASRYNASVAFVQNMHTEDTYHLETIAQLSTHVNMASCATQRLMSTGPAVKEAAVDAHVITH